MSNEKRIYRGKLSEICLCFEYKTESVAKESFLESFYVIKHRNNYLGAYVCIYATSKCFARIYFICI